MPKNLVNITLSAVTEEIEIILLDIYEVKKLVEDNAIKQSMHELCLYKAFKKLEDLY